MAEQLTNYIALYGYLAIFCMVVLQESGVPGFPNELVLLYFGYLSRQAHLQYPLVISVVAIADLVGSFLLYLLFYYGSGLLQRLKPGWLTVPLQKIDSMKKRIANNAGRSIFIGKLTPFVRGYVPVVAGILHISPLLYGRMIFLTDVVWSGGWVTAGWLFSSLLYKF
jgi:membrane protein DedA with SNARE-associated domain